MIGFVIKLKKRYMHHGLVSDVLCEARVEGGTCTYTVCSKMEHPVCGLHLGQLPWNNLFVNNVSFQKLVPASPSI